jgi:hypothetical protein
MLCQYQQYTLSVLQYGYPIHIPHLQRLIRPDETVELDDHDWIRKQIGYGTFILLED